MTKVSAKQTSEASQDAPSHSATIMSVVRSIEVKSAVLRYPLGPARSGSLKASMMRLLGHRERTVEIQYVDALKNVSFSILDGERVGIIGRNGSGKSTLLRTLAGVYPLESGEIRVRGEIGTLLDISLGFELESTGRENIYNRGLAMGYSRKQMQAVEHEIVQFADLGDFIDLPMRTYSSGMFVRLGFAISTQFVPDVLLVDEVFAAGDGVFARRAIERMNHIVSNAGIVVVVSHDLTTITQICERIIWIDYGTIKMDGPANEVVKAFSAFISETADAAQI